MVIATAKVMAARYRAQNGIIEDKQGNQHWVGKDDPEAQREIEDLRERIKVLERIATDGNSLDAQETKRIAAEIEALREKQAD
ncbi:hypothetical protein K3152_13645 [Qipengyuania sp. 1NDH17]|uniref:Uncharacterized protein n=2 Tax=Qipengyuania polymorpha TaxID=2867234 RepID=A0ABS7J0E2_9SPHN|nr:hypothetical protein [Qipengyuania polymorpha]MBX7459292.1 hypothetical protein [Qipengyuania polymorpha]